MEERLPEEPQVLRDDVGVPVADARRAGASDSEYDENITRRMGFWCRNICHCVAAVAITRTAAGTRQRLLRNTGTGCQIETQAILRRAELKA